MTKRPPPKNNGSMMAGFFGIAFFTLILTLVNFFILSMYAQSGNDGNSTFMTMFYWAFWNIGWSSLIYTLPIAYILKKHGRSQTAKGVMFFAGLAFLLTGLCNAALFSGGAWY
jgi:hypothetical protein